MATEVAITSMRPADAQALHAAGTTVVPGCALVELRSGEVWVVVTPAGERLVTVHASTPIDLRDDVDALTGRDSGITRWWTVAAVPHGAPDLGVDLAHQLARELDGDATVLS